MRNYRKKDQIAKDPYYEDSTREEYGFFVIRKVFLYQNKFVSLYRILVLLQKESLFWFSHFQFYMQPLKKQETFNISKCGAKHVSSSQECTLTTKKVD